MAEANVLVIIPSYNHGRFIEARVRSVLQQTAGHLDVRLIDDGSSDQTMTVLEGIRDPRLIVSQRPENSGSPFTAWIETCDILAEGRHDYVWIAESDDRAAPDFLANGLMHLEKSRDAALYYTHSWFIDERDLIIGHSINYLKKYFPELDWSTFFSIDGHEYVRTCLLRGMAIPNMSSALIRAGPFSRAVNPEFRRFRLAADWIFAIALSCQGAILFDPRDSNYFRHHSRTARSEAHSARVVVEHMSAAHAAFATGLCEEDDYRAQMTVWSGMYRHEKVNRIEFIAMANNINPHAINELLSFLPD